jgi:hypothetical protein
MDDGLSWFSLRQNLPPVPVHDIALKDGDLIAGTHGRSFWILDDISVLRQLTPTLASARAHLFQPRDVPRITWGGGSPTGPRPTGANPPSGTILQYHIASARLGVRSSGPPGLGTSRKRTSSSGSIWPLGVRPLAMLERYSAVKR